MSNIDILSYIYYIEFRQHACLKDIFITSFRRACYLGRLL